LKELLRLSDTELILNNDLSIYHLGLLPEHLSENIIVVGDPNRVQKVSQYFDKLIFKTEKREFVTHVGILKNQQITVISSGIGVDNVELLMTELDFLANFDLATRIEKENKKSLNIIRIGTSGSIQEDVGVNSLAVSTCAIGLDNLMDFYGLFQNEQSKIITDCLKKEIPNQKSNPYLSKANQQLINKLGGGLQHVNTLTCPGFYAPQGRITRAKTQNSLIETFRDFRFEDFKIHNLEMETAGYYAFGQLLGHNIVSLNAILANRITNEFSKDPEFQIDQLIQFVLNKLV
jgi:uridine phosphorylase